MSSLKSFTRARQAQLITKHLEEACAIAESEHPELFLPDEWKSAEAMSQFIAALYVRFGVVFMDDARCLAEEAIETVERRIRDRASGKQLKEQSQLNLAANPNTRS